MFRKFSISLIVTIFCLLGTAHGSAALENWRRQIYEAYVLNNMPQWDRTVRAMEAAYVRNPSNELLYDLLLAQYGLIGYYLGNNDRSKAEPLLNRAEQLLEELRRMPGRQAEALAFEAAFIGYRISIRPIRAVMLGTRSMRAADRAVEANPRYPRAWIEKGNIMFFAPAPFGNKNQAITEYKKGIELLEANMQPSHRWLYLSTLVSLAGAYEKTGNIALAIQTLEKALRFEPRFKWPEEEMLPKLRTQQAGL